MQRFTYRLLLTQAVLLWGLSYCSSPPAQSEIHEQYNAATVHPHVALPGNCLNWFSEELFNQATHAQRHPQHSYRNFITAMSEVPQFICARTEAQQRRELAAVFAHFWQETSGLKYIEELCGANGSCSHLYNYDWSGGSYPPQLGVGYYGRGAKQLSYPGNYGQASQFLFGDKSVLLKNPAMVADNGKVSFATAFWFWAVRDEDGGSCSDAFWHIGFGATTNIINGKVECGIRYGSPAKAREAFYQRMLTVFGARDARPVSKGCRDDGVSPFKKGPNKSWPKRAPPPLRAPKRL